MSAYGVIEKLKAILDCESQTELALLLGITQSAVSRWIAHNAIPPAQALRIEQLSGGIIKRHEICPELFAGYQPVEGAA